MESWWNVPARSLCERFVDSVIHTIPTTAAFWPRAVPLDTATTQPVTSSSREALTKPGIREVSLSRLDFSGSSKVDIPADGTFPTSPCPLQVLLPTAGLQWCSGPQWSIAWVSFWVCSSIFRKRVGTHLLDYRCSQARLKWVWKQGGSGWRAENQTNTNNLSKPCFLRKSH